MLKKQLLTLLQHRTAWLVLLSGLVTSVAVLAIARNNSPSPQVSQSLPASPSPTPVLPSPLLFKETLSPPASPAASSTPLPSPSVQSSPSPQPQPTQQPAKPNTSINPAAYTEEQKAINQKAKERFLSSLPSADAMIEMHVAIANGVSSLSLKTSTPAEVRDAEGKLLHQLAPEESYTAQAAGSEISLGGWELPSIVSIEIPPNGLFYLGERAYRGRLLLMSDRGGLWAVNYINLKQYLYSVVGSEVSPSWDIEALKAQAVAARSYALTYYFRPVSSFYHLGSDEYYQVYSGIAREADETSKAVDLTAGEFVSHNGGVVESLYAASDEIVAEAFEGKGMSQLGALNLAEQGYTYRQILGNYYPGTAVSRIELDLE